MKMMKQILILVSLVLLAGCSSKEGLPKLQGIWLVDTKSTMLEHGLGKQVLGWDDHVTPDNLSRIHYEFRGDHLLSFTCYQAEIDTGFSNRVSVYEQDDTSVIVLIHPEKKGYTTDHPPLDELIKRDPIAAFHGIRGLVGFEFTKEHEAKLFRITLDAKRNRVRNYTGMHLVRADGPIPERKKQLPNNISLENPNCQLALKFTIPATDETWDVKFSTIDQSTGGGGGQHNSTRNVYTSRTPKGIKVTAKYRWKAGRSECSFIVPYGEDTEGHLNGITYRATWKEEDKANQ
jgi:hypothetical protein